MCKSTFSLNVYCRPSKRDRTGKSPLELSIVVNQKRLFINLPYKARPEEFNRKRQPREIREYCDTVMKRIEEILQEMNRREIPVTAQAIREYVRTGGFKAYSIKELFNDFLSLQRKRIGNDLTQGGYRKYVLLSEMFLSTVEPDMECDRVTPQMIQSFQLDLNGRYSVNSAASYMGKLKTVIKFGMDNGRFKINPFQGIKVRREKKQIDYLTDEEVAAIKDTQIDNESLRNVRDAFLLQVYSGLSYIDLEHLRKEDIRITPEGTHYIQKQRIKSGVTFTSVILPDGIDILKRCNYSMRVISNQKMNVYLKQVMTLCGLNHKLTTHLGRKTYGHILLNRGVRIETVARALGHSEAKTTARYYAEVMPSTVINEISSVTN